MKNKANELIELIDTFQKEFSNIDDEIASVNLSQDKWSLKQILGHLIDSASNNHQRFVRLQLSDTIEFPDYHNEAWLKAQKHNKMQYNDILQLFISSVRFKKVLFERNKK